MFLFDHIDPLFSLHFNAFELSLNQRQFLSYCQICRGIILREDKMPVFPLWMGLGFEILREVKPAWTLAEVAYLGLQALSLKLA